MENSELWQRALSEIELNISRANFITWFKNTDIASCDDTAATINTPNGFAKEWLENKYNKFILRALRNIKPTIKEIVYIIRRSEDLNVVKEKRRKKIIESAPLEDQLEFKEFEIDKETNLNPKYTFETFIVGSSNELAHAASLAVAKNPGLTYNPLFIYGGTGLGKTHLLEAIGNEINKNSTKLKVKYVTSEKFTSELISAITNHETERFKNDYRKVDVLIIDDIQFLAGKEKTQEEFFHTFNVLYETNKQIVLSSDRPPKAIPTLEDRLRSRFEGGMIADISYPDYETRLAILKTKAGQRGLILADEILQYLANNIQKNIRELEGALHRILAYSKVNNKLPNLEEVIKIISAVINNPKKMISIKQIIKVVADFYDIDEKELFKKTRRQEIVKPRQIIMYLLRDEVKASYPLIGQKLGDRDHTTAIHAYEKIKKELAKSDNLVEEINLIKQRLYS